MFRLGKLDTGNWTLDTGNWKLDTRHWKLDTIDTGHEYLLCGFVWGLGAGGGGEQYSGGLREWWGDVGDFRRASCELRREGGGGRRRRLGREGQGVQLWGEGFVFFHKLWGREGFVLGTLLGTKFVVVLRFCPKCYSCR